MSNWIPNEKLNYEEIQFSILSNMIYLFEENLPKKILKTDNFQLIKYRLEELKKRVQADRFQDCN